MSEDLGWVFVARAGERHKIPAHLPFPFEIACEPTASEGEIPPGYVGWLPVPEDGEEEEQGHEVDIIPLPGTQPEPPKGSQPQPAPKLPYRPYVPKPPFAPSLIVNSKDLEDMDPTDFRDLVLNQVETALPDYDVGRGFKLEIETPASAYQNVAELAEVVDEAKVSELGANEVVFRLGGKLDE